MKRRQRNDIRHYSAHNNVRLYAQIMGVEIFAEGTHNGDPYSAADLDSMVEAFNALDFKPALKGGHTNAPGTPALGYVENLRRDGAKLVGDLIDVPDTVYAQIKNKAFNRVSAEIAWNFERAGKTFKRALMAVALLGAEVPGVAGLKPLSSAFAECKADVKFYDRAPIQIETNQSGDHDMTQAELDAAIAKAAKETEDRLRKEFADAEAKRVKEYSEQRVRDQAEIARLSAVSRQTSIDALADRCKIPALRPMLRAFADMAMAIAPNADGKLRTYALDSDKQKALEPMAVVDATIAYLNDKASKLFTVVSKVDGRTVDKGHQGEEHNEVPEAHEDIAGAVDKLTKEFQAKNPTVKSYGDAMRTVLRDPANADIAEAYRVKQGGKPKAA